MAPLTELPAWKALGEHYKKIEPIHLKELFDKDPKRAEKFNVEAAGLFLDYSKNRITEETVKLLLQLAEESGVAARRDAMFSGEKINITEKRAVLHVALRAPKGEKIVVDGEDVVPAVHEVLDKMAAFASAFARARGRGIPASRSRTSSILVSAAPILGRSWRMRR